MSSVHFYSIIRFVHDFWKTYSIPLDPNAKLVSFFLDNIFHIFSFSNCFINGSKIPSKPVLYKYTSLIAMII